MKVSKVNVGDRGFVHSEILYFFFLFFFYTGLLLKKQKKWWLYRGSSQHTAILDMEGVAVCPKRRKLTCIQYHTVHINQSMSDVDDDLLPSYNLSEVRANSILCRWWKRQYVRGWNSRRLFPFSRFQFKKEILESISVKVWAKLSKQKRYKSQYVWKQTQSRLIHMFESCVKRRLFAGKAEYPLFSVVALWTTSINIDFFKMIEFLYKKREGVWYDGLNVVIKNKVASEYLVGLNDVLGYYMEWQEKHQGQVSTAKSTIYYDVGFCDKLYKNMFSLMTLWRSELCFWELYSIPITSTKHHVMYQMSKESVLYVKYLHETVFSCEDSEERRSQQQILGNHVKEVVKFKSQLTKMALNQMEENTSVVKTPLYSSSEVYGMDELLMRQRYYLERHGDEGEFLSNSFHNVLANQRKRITAISNGNLEFMSFPYKKNQIFYSPYSVPTFLEAQPDLPKSWNVCWDKLQVESSSLKVKMSSLYENMFISLTKKTFAMTTSNATLHERLNQKYLPLLEPQYAIMLNDLDLNLLDSNRLIFCTETFMELLDDVSQWIFSLLHVPKFAFLKRKDVWRELWILQKNEIESNQAIISKLAKGDLYDPIEFEQQVKDYRGTSITDYFKRKYTRYFALFLGCFRISSAYFWAVHQLYVSLSNIREIQLRMECPLQYDDECVAEELTNMNMTAETVRECMWPDAHVKDNMERWTASVRDAFLWCNKTTQINTMESIQVMHKQGVFSLVDSVMHQSYLKSGWPAFLKNDVNDLRLLRRVWRWSIAYYMIYQKLREVAAVHSTMCTPSHVQYHMHFKKLVETLVIFPFVSSTMGSQEENCTRVFDEFLWLEASKFVYDADGNCLASKYPWLSKRKTVTTSTSIIVGLDPHAIEKTIALGINCLKDLIMMSTDPRAKRILYTPGKQLEYKELHSALEKNIIGILPTLFTRETGENCKNMAVVYETLGAKSGGANSSVVEALEYVHATLTPKEHAFLNGFRSVWLSYDENHRGKAVATLNLLLPTSDKGEDHEVLVKCLMASIMRFDRICNFNLKCFRPFYEQLLGGI